MLPSLGKASKSDRFLEFEFLLEVIIENLGRGWCPKIT